MEMTLESPTLADKEELLQLQADFQRNNEIMHGDSYLSETPRFEDWLALQVILADEALLPEDRVAGVTLLVKYQEKIIGIVNLRYWLNDYLLHFGGHIGYSLKAEYRNKGYGTELLALVLKVARKKGINPILITCDVENVGSARVIEKNGGVLENIVIEPESKRQVKRYWID